MDGEKKIVLAKEESNKSIRYRPSFPPGTDVVAKSNVSDTLTKLVITMTPPRKEIGYTRLIPRTKTKRAEITSLLTSE